MNCRDEPRATTRDAFHDNRFQLIQPKGWGYRAGLDATLLTASVPQAAKGRAADLGAGSGAVGFALAARCAALDVVLAEREEVMTELLGRSLALEANAGFAERLRVARLDVLSPRPVREAAGLFDGAFDLVATNPPFHPAGGRLPPDAARAAALAMPGPDFLARWIATAAALLRPRGVLALVARPDNLAAILNAAEGRLGDLRVVAVHSREGEPATRILVHARRGSRAPLRLLPALTLRDGANAPLGVERALGAGTAFLDLGLL